MPCGPTACTATRSASTRTAAGRLPRSRALHALLPAELYDTFVATKARDPRYFNMLTEDLKEVLSLELPESTDPVESEKSISRMTLRQVLLTGLEGVVEFGKEFTRFERHGDQVT